MENAESSAGLKFIFSFITCVALAFVADMTVAMLRGYAFRADTGLLIGLELIVLGFVFGAGLFVVRLARRGKSEKEEGVRLGGRVGPRVALASVAFAVLLTLVLLQTPTHPSGAVLAPPRADGAASLEPATPENPNLLLVVLDTTRADRLSVYGHDKVSMPWLDAFAEDATVFDFAFSSSSYTLPSHASLFTGLYPRAHGAQVLDAAEKKDGEAVDLEWLGTMRLRPLSLDALTLAEIAHAKGLETGAIAANSAYLAPEFQLDQGFDTYVSAPRPSPSLRPVGLKLAYLAGESLRLRPLNWLVNWPIRRNEVGYMLGSEVNALVSRWLPERADRRFFLFVNYMEPHDPYWSVGEREGLLAGDTQGDIDRYSIRDGRSRLTDEQAARISEAYDREVDQLDVFLSELMNEVESLCLLEETLVLLVGDHGDSHSEHGQVFHPDSLYQPEIHVPLIMKRPGQTSGERVDRMVHMVDVFPTLLEEMGWPAPPGIQGMALLGDVGGGKGASKREVQRPFPIIADLGPYRRVLTEEAIIEDPWKLIRNSEGAIELYDLRADPNELQDQSEKKPEVVRALLKQLDGFEAEVAYQFDEGELDMSEETLQTLRDLGYMQ